MLANSPSFLALESPRTSPRRSARNGEAKCERDVNDREKTRASPLSLPLACRARPDVIALRPT
eukprot:4128219-Pleurochrysis_carterae.AAC.1